MFTFSSLLALSQSANDYVQESYILFHQIDSVSGLNAEKQIETD